VHIYSPSLSIIGESFSIAICLFVKGNPLEQPPHNVPRRVQDRFSASPCDASGDQQNQSGFTAHIADSEESKKNMDIHRSSKYNPKMVKVLQKY
jgi:hypothetical protein